jgi:hypothetical protein
MTWVEPPSDFDEHSLAEFIEAELIFDRDDYLSLTEIRSLFPSGRQPTDDELTMALAEVERRGREYGEHYPFLVDDRGVLHVRDERARLYELLLLLSLKGTPTRVAGEYARSDPLFDAVVREAFKGWLGPNTHALTFAWPPRAGRPTKFPDAVEWAAKRLGLVARRSEIPDNPLDGGVDVIVWRPFPDGRLGFEIYLVQNTVQLSFSKKPYDIVPLQWVRWWNISTPPLVGFAVPFALPQHDPWWTQVTYGVMLPMDRGRLLTALEGREPKHWPEWAALRTYVEEELSAVREAGGFSPATTVTVPRRRKPKAASKSATSA